ncbi:protein of unknown function (plasmid) [Pararobbsia alpina]
MPREVPRKAEQLGGQRRPLLNEWYLRIQSGLGKTLEQVLARIEPLMRFRHSIDDRWIYSKCLAGFAQRTAWSIGGDGGRERRTVPSVLGVDVLDDFLASLMFEIDIDIGRLTALLLDEALKQHAGAGRIDFGHAEAKTHRGVGG